MGTWNKSAKTAIKGTNFLMAITFSTTKPDQRDRGRQKRVVELMLSIIERFLSSVELCEFLANERFLVSFDSPISIATFCL
jgi:hypothetical protein